MSTLFNLVLLASCLTAITIADSIPNALQGTWTGSVTYSSLDDSVPPNCCAGNYSAYDLAQPGRYDVGISLPLRSDLVTVSVTDDSITVHPTNPTSGPTSCVVGFPSDLTVTGVSVQNAALDCYVGTFNFVPANSNFGGYLCTFTLTATGEFAIDFVRCYWLNLLSAGLPCPNELSGPDPNLRTVVEDQCAVFNGGGYSASDWYTTPVSEPWDHTFTPPASCSISAPSNGVLNTCTDPLPDSTSCSFACDANFQLDGPATISCSNGVLSTLQTCDAIPPQGSHCGVLIAPGQCQVGFVGAPSCCTRISDQSPVVTATLQGGNIHFAIVSNTLPADYVYNMGLSLSTSNFFSCQATNPTVTPVGTTQQSSEWDVPVTGLGACLTTEHAAPGVRFEGYVVLSLQFAPWGDSAYIGLYFFGLTVEITNSTDSVSLLSVTQELEGNGLEVVVNPSATLTHCVSVPCTQVNPVYFARVGDSEVYLVVADANGQSGTASVESVVFEDENHVAVGFTSVLTLDALGLNVTFGFTVPASAVDARYLRVTVQIDFNSGSSADYQTQFTALAAQKTYVAQSRFEVTASSATSVMSSIAMVMAMIVALVMWA